MVHEMRNVNRKIGPSAGGGHTERGGRIRTGLFAAAAALLVLAGPAGARPGIGATAGTGGASPWAGSPIGAAWAYFSATASTSGGQTLRLGHEEHADETFSSWTKTVRITSTEDSWPVYVRARGFSDYALDYGNAGSWEADGDWMYYSRILPPGETADDLVVQIRDVPDASTPGLADGEDFNVIIVYETAPVEYGENGDPVGARNVDWTRKVDTYRTGTGSTDGQAAENGR